MILMFLKCYILPNLFRARDTLGEMHDFQAFKQVVPLENKK